MIPALARHDPALKPFALLVRFLAPLAFVPFLRLVRMPPSGPGPFGHLLAVVYLLVVTFSWFATAGVRAQGRTRVFGYQLALPVSARTLVGLRIAAHSICGLILCAAMLVLFLSVPSGPSAPTPLGITIQLVALACGWGFSILLLFVSKPSQPQVVPAGLHASLAMLGAVVLALAWFAPHFVLLFTFPSILGMAIYLWHRIPRTMTLTDLPGETSPSATTSPNVAAAQEDRRPPGRALGSLALHLWLARWALHRPQILFSSLIVGFITLLSQGRSGYLVNLIMATVFVTTLFRTLAATLGNVNALPFSRRAMATWTLLPPAIVLLLGTLIGQALSHERTIRRPELGPSLYLEETHEELASLGLNWHVSIPGELLEFHWGNEPISIEGPSGEMATTQPEPLFWALPLGLTNPYEVNSDSSARFIAWQLSRAMQHGYGINLSPEAVQTSYMNGTHYRRAFFHRDYPNIKAITNAQGRLALGLALSCLVWAAAMVLYSGQRLPPETRPQWRRRIVARSLGGVALLSIVIGLAVFNLKHAFLHDGLRSATEAWLARAMAAHPWSTGSGAVLLITGLAIAGSRRLRSMETPEAIVKER